MIALSEDNEIMVMHFVQKFLSNWLKYLVFCWNNSEPIIIVVNALLFSLYPDTMFIQTSFHVHLDLQYN
jgi:hypothetical protein